MNFAKESNRGKSRLYPATRVLIIDGGSRQALPMIKGFHNLGCYVTAYCGSKLDVGYVSRYTDERILSVYETENKTATYDEIKRVIANGQYDLVVPMNDFAATLLAEHKQELSEYAYISVNDWNIYQKACDKLQTMKICMEHKIPCPKTAVIDIVEQFDDTEWQYPLVIKPRSGYGANGFNTVNNREELIEHFHATERKCGPALVQEYIPQTDSQYQVEMFIDSNQQCKSFVLMDKLRWYPINGGSSTLNVTVTDERIKKDCIDLLRTMGWKGYASLDLIRDPRDGTAKILEINPRINGTVKICFAAGVDISLQLLEEALGQQISEFFDYKQGVYLRYFHMDVLWFIKSSKRWTTKPSWFSWKNTVDEIIAFDDLLPFFMYSLTSIKKLLRDKAKRGIS